MVPRVLNNKNKKTMKKFYLKNGKEVKIGDTITKVTKDKCCPFGGECSSRIHTVNSIEVVIHFLYLPVKFLCQLFNIVVKIHM